MDPEVAILNAALELIGGERAAYLETACAGDDRLRHRVEELLQAHEQAEDFLQTSPAAQLRRRASIDIPVTEKPGDHIGRYKLLQQIGEGGCGVVYMAEQEHPVRRRVALKVIKLGMDTKQVVARFEAERQALALMDHPNIARVLDAGATAAGRPFFVMELVRGIRITQFCDENQVRTEERLRMFIQVCQAIQHAHQKGIIHRDIKPSNILVTVNDGVPVPKVIDFGIAKATAGRLTNRTLFTAFEQFIGTPAYMSPEQAVMTSLDIDTRSDIYSLGVLLYELLTGTTPFDSRELLEAGLDEMRRIIREQEPLKPSTRLSTMLDAERRTAAGRRQTEHPKLIHRVRGDLDWIVMKALEKDRARRYETANGLAADIQRHLNCEPVVARPPSRWYEFQKTLLRHKFGFAAAATLILVLTLGIITSTWQAIRATRAEREQVRLRLEAETARANEAALRKEREARLEIARAREFARRKDYAHAEEILNAIDPAYLTGNADAAECRRAIAWDWTSRLKWKEASDRLAILVREDASAWNGTVAEDYAAYAGALLQTGNAPEYESFRRSILTRFATRDDPRLSEFLCAIAMFTPANPEVADAMSRHYAVAKTLGGYSEEGSQWQDASHRYALALTDYHRGNFRKAAPLCASALTLPGVSDNFIATGLALNALVQHQLGNETDARMALTLCHQRIDPLMKNGPESAGVKSFDRWWVWLMAANLQSEADAMMGAPDAGDYARLNETRATLAQVESFAANPRFYDATRAEYDRARESAASMPAVIQRMEGKKFADLLVALGLWGLQHRDWPQATTNWDLVACGPSQNGSLLYGRDLSDFYLSYALLLAEQDDPAAYDRFRTTALATFGKTLIPINAARTLDACLLRPADTTSLATLLTLADRLATAPTATNASSPGNLTLALLKYRNHDPAGALRLIGSDLNLSTLAPDIAARAHVLKALCLAQTGNRNASRSELDLVRDSIQSKFNSPPVSDPANLASWRGWWTDHVLLREAESADANPSAASE